MITDDIFTMLLSILLFIMLILVSLMVYKVIYGMARVYNWNGKRYCYVGYAQVRKERGCFALYLGERMVDLSRTTLYRICLSNAFCKKNRYRAMYVYADGSRSYLVVDRDAMTRKSIFSYSLDFEQTEQT